MRRRFPARGHTALPKNTLLAVVIAVFLGLLLPRVALADPELVARASASQVEVGETFTIELKALSEQGSSTPRNPAIHPPPQITVVSGPMLSSQTVAQFGGGVSSVKVGLGATWQLVATATGHFVIPGPTIRWERKRFRANPIPITVVAATGRPRRPSHRVPSNPFLLPGGPSHGFPWPFNDLNPFDDQDDIDDPGATELSMPRAPDPTVFLRAIADKKSAVVGEQITLSFYLYYRENLEMGERHEAPLSDFRRVPLLKNPGTDAPMHARVGGRRYEIRLLDRMALFPLRAGDLHTGSFGARITGRRIGSRVLRESDDLVLHVTEPPLAGRPPGYVLGDVGRFNLSVGVQPRRVDQGGSIAVTVKVTGTGNFPQSLRVPERTGIEWLDPEKRESIEPRGGVIAGFRSFGYVVRIKESGAVDLGAIELPYWNPEGHRYVVERAELGTIDVTPVTPNAAHPAPAAANAATRRGDPFAAMPSPRAVLGATTPLPPRGFRGTPLWLLLAAPPLLVITSGAGERVIRWARARRTSGATSPARLTAIALREADEAAAGGDVKETAAAIERAVHRAIEAATALRSRGVLLSALPDELERAGVPRELADRACKVLSTCASVRFDPALDNAAAATDLAARARTLTADLARWKRG